MEQITLSEQHQKAVELHQKIIISANLAQQNLWDMCTALKTMRDNKLYKELGYGNFEEYCENEVGFSARNARNYISIVEKVSIENRKSISHFGMTKLSLLTTISQSEQEKIAEKVDLENISVRKLKEEIESIKAEKQKEINRLELKNQKLEQVADEATDTKTRLERTLQSERRKLSNATADKEWLEKKVQELESRPVEVAVVDNSDNERRLQETIKSLERENIKRNEELERQYREDEQAVRKMLEQEKQDALKELTDEYEDKIKELQAKKSDKPANQGAEAFKVWKLVAVKALNNLHRIIIENADDGDMQSIFRREMSDVTVKVQNIVEI